MKPEGTKVQPPTPPGDVQLLDKSRKVRGLKNYSALPNLSSKEGGFKVSNGVRRDPKKGDTNLTGDPLLTSVDLGKNLIPQKDGPSDLKENKEPKGSID